MSSTRPAEQNRGDDDHHRDGNAALSEFVPSFDPDEWDEETVEAFRCIVEAVNRLRERPASRNAGTSRPFSLDLDWDDWDDDFAALLAQIGHAIEELRAAMEDGEPFPSADFVFRIDESIFDDDLVVFVRRIQVELNGLREGQSPRAVDSQLMLFDLSETHTQDPKTGNSQPSDTRFQTQEAPRKARLRQAALLAKAAVDGGATTFEEYVAHAAQQLGSDGARRESPFIEIVWNAMRQRKGYEHLGPAGKVADLIPPDARCPTGRRVAGVGKSSTPPSKSAEVHSRKDESSWQSLVIAARDSGEHGKAMELAEQAVREHPRSDFLWRMLGGELTELGRLDEAENALDTA